MGDLEEGDGGGIREKEKGRKRAGARVFSTRTPWVKVGKGSSEVFPRLAWDQGVVRMERGIFTR